MALTFLRALGTDGRRFCTCAAGYLDGYGWGERLLEGIAFEFRVTPDGSGLTARMASPSAAAYYARLNDARRCANGIAYALRQDIFSSSADLSDDSVVLYDDALPHHAQRFYCPEQIEIDGAGVTGRK